MKAQQRLNGLREQMARRELELVVYGPGPDMQYLTGLSLDWRAGEKMGTGSSERSETCLSPFSGCLFVPRDRPEVLVLGRTRAEQPPPAWIQDVRTCDRDDALDALLRDVAREAGAQRGPIAAGRVCGRVSAALAAAAPDAEAVDATGLLDRLRMIKEPEEIQRLRSVARLTDDAVQAALPKIREGVTQSDIQAEIELQGRRLGASGVSFPPAVIFTLSGSEPSDEAFTYPKDEGLVAGVSIALDIGFVKDGYCSDFGRSFYFGPAPGHIREGYAALQQSVLDTVATMRDGSPRFCDLFPAVEASLDRRGYGKYLRARLPSRVLGHNIGIDVHEDPWINPDCDWPLRAGMVMALEPKLWHSGEYYLRVEDLVLVGEQSAEILTNFPRDLFEL